MTTSLKIAFIKANWHSEIVDQTLVGFEAYLAEQALAAEVTPIDVPGAFEMPLLAQKLAKTGAYDVIVAAALVVDGGIYRHDFVAQSVVSGLMDAQMNTGVPVLSVSLTPHHFQPNDEHQKFYFEHFIKKGREAAQAAVQIAKVHTSIK